MAQTQTKISRTKVAESYPEVLITRLPLETKIGDIAKMADCQLPACRIPYSKEEINTEGMSAEELIANA